jgi:hypothetical protein
MKQLNIVVKNSVNTANTSTGVGITLSNEGDYIPVATEPEISKESGQSKCTWVL